MIDDCQLIAYSGRIVNTRIQGFPMVYFAQGIQLLLILFFLPSAVLKLIGHAHMRREFVRFQFPYWLARLAGAIELVACLLLIVGFAGSLWGWFGTLLLVCVMIGATWTNFTKRPAVFGWGTLVILLLCAGTSAWQLSQIGSGCATSVEQFSQCLLAGNATQGA